MEPESIKIPGYYWEHYSPDNVFKILRAVDETRSRYVADWFLSYNGRSKKVSIDPHRHSIEKKSFEIIHQPMSKFPNEEMPYIIRAIFTNLEVMS